MAIHVDDGIIIGSDLQKIQTLITKLQKAFEITITLKLT
jgi:hypothetical protein